MILRKPAPYISYQYKIGKKIDVHLKCVLPIKRKRVIDDNPRRNYTTVYFGISHKSWQKLADLARKTGKTESAVLRDILDKSLKKDNYECLPPYNKTSIIGMKVLPRTVTKEHDRLLRAISTKTGRAISEIVRFLLREYIKTN